MPNNSFRFKQFNINQQNAAFKVGTDGVLLGALAGLPAAGRILDVGTGTGLIALMAAQRTECDIVALEPDHDSFIQARENISQSKWADRITILECTFTEYYSGTKEKFVSILSNPPYFRNSLKNREKAKSVARHADSLTREELLTGSSMLLTDNGSLHIILPYTEGSDFISKATEKMLYCNKIIRIKTTPSGNAKRVILQFEKAKRPLNDSAFTIHSGEGSVFSNEYIEATKEFYLKF
ncbi:MAG: methyltransferase [Bacteroidales bacterium]|nr:methyltransferase [Bacteroidales bacterium]